jgi:sulfur carrier protein ThiS
MSRELPSYSTVNGLEMDLKEGARVRDLLADLNIAAVRKGIVMVNGLARKADDPLRDGEEVLVFSQIAGG